MKYYQDKRARERGATGTEYALLIAFVSLAIVTAAVGLGTGFNVWADTLVDTVSDLLS